TFVVQPGEVARVKALFDKEGLYVWHCHILSHEDFDMMRPFYVGDMPKPKEESFAISQDLEAEILTSMEVAPNPFKETTQINFSFKENAVVILQIYDFLGREVAAPFSGPINANQNYEVQFDRKNLPGSTYIFKLSTSDGRSYEKIVLAN
ncbi:MAG TPA: multicopper oxidase domain-containing protein, partial [Gillisia sp.]|nr:multicopper oxidase domain-containing protein [Gillisia sp.]